jgi:alcohol dehydrogenase
MKALVYHGPSQRGWDTVADPTIIDPTDIACDASV